MRLRMFLGWIGAASGVIVLATACSKSTPPSFVNVDQDAGPLPTGTTTTPPLGDTGAAPLDDATPPDDTGAVATDAGPAKPDFGPIPDDGPVDGAIAPPPPTYGPLTWCTSDVDKLASTALTAGGSTPKAFADAWNAQAAKSSAGVMLLQFSGLKSDPPKVSFSIGTSDQKSPPAFAIGLPGPAGANAAVDSASHVADANSLSGFALRFGTGSGDPVLVFGAFKFHGVFDATCQSVGSVDLILKIRTSAGDTPFGGSTLKALLGDPTDVIGTDDAWRIELTGSAPHTGS